MLWSPSKSKRVRVRRHDIAARAAASRNRARHPDGDEIFSPRGGRVTRAAISFSCRRSHPEHATDASRVDRLRTLIFATRGEIRNFAADPGSTGCAVRRVL